ncbi:MAG: hypothetical protein ACRD35_05725 [Candidatus Acidiferrales bacterium]
MPRRASLLLLVLWAVVALPAAAASLESWTTNYPLPAGGRISLANVQGSIWIEAWDRAEVELSVRKATAGTNERLAEVEVAVERGRDWLRIQTVYQGNAEPVRVEYRLRVPRQVRLEELRTVNGDVVVRDVEGVVEARTLNGHIEETGVVGSVAAHSVNGNITVALRRLPEPTGRLVMETINGDLRLLLPASSQADLEMSTVAGQIESDLALSARAVPGETTLRARLGRGGVPARLRTIRGNIYVGENQDQL